MTRVHRTEHNVLSCGRWRRRQLWPGFGGGVSIGGSAGPAPCFAGRHKKPALMESETAKSETRRVRRTNRGRWKTAGATAASILLVYFAVAYMAIPWATEQYFNRHPWLVGLPGVTQTADGHPGDPLNLALIGDESEVKALFAAAGWHPADPLGLRSDLRIAGATVLHQAYDTAPVSNLYLFGRKEDMAFEQPSGRDPRKRHHVRFWRAGLADSDGQPVWVGSASYDDRVGFSHTTGQITHHISPDVDAERDYLFECLSATGRLAETYAVEDFHKVREGRNGGGDPWHTDGRLRVGRIAASR